MTKELVANGNGSLPASRQAAVEQGLQYFNETAAERDRLSAENAQLKLDLATTRIALEAKDVQYNEMHSRLQSAELIKDQANADRAVYETLFVSLQSQLRAFKIPATPLIKTREEM